MSNDNGQQPAAAAQSPTENKPAAPPSEISSLGKMREQERSSSARPEQQSRAGEGSPTTTAAPSQPDGREPFIPRERFDQVNAQKNQLQAQLEQTQALLNQRTGMQTPNPQWQGPVNPGIPQGVSPTGMLGAQPVPQGVTQEQAREQAQSFLDQIEDPKVQKEWQKRIANDPIQGLRDFVTSMIDAQASPALERVKSELTSQLAPIQQSFMAQQLQGYVSQRSQDPTFAQVQPYFNQLVSAAAQRGVPITAQSLASLEGIARAQTGLLTAQPQAQVPFMERPGGAPMAESQGPKVSLTPQEAAIAERFGMTPEEYTAARGGYTNG